MLIYYFEDNGKYVIESRGLRINKLDLRDNGTYECLAELKDRGLVRKRQVTVDILCEYQEVIEQRSTYIGNALRSLKCAFFIVHVSYYARISHR